MTEIEYYLVDVFTTQKYGGNQLAVFVDFENQVSTENMLKIARELNFPEITFIKKSHNNEKFDVRIFTSEYEVPFAGHPSLGTAFIISKYLLPKPKDVGMDFLYQFIEEEQFEPVWSSNPTVTNAATAAATALSTSAFEPIEIVPADFSVAGLITSKGLATTGSTHSPLI